MRISINLLFVQPGRIGGSEIFVTNLVENLLRIDETNEYTLIVCSNNEQLFSTDAKNVEYLRFNFNNSSRIKRVFVEQFVLPEKLRERKVDLLIAPGNTGLIRCPCKQLLIVHDLIYFVYPKYYSLAKRTYLQNLVKYSCKKADGIIAVSQNTKNDITKYTGVNENKISVIHEGVDFERFSRIKKDEAQKFVQKQYGIREYIYSPTSLYRHKNNDSLVKVFAKLRNEKKIHQKLIITGIDPYRRINRLKDIITKLGMNKEIFYLGRIPNEYLPYLYSGADIVMYLSSYEGFGLPVLEAMASGSPVLSSNRSSLPEVVENAGVLVDPFDIEDIANRVYELLTNEGLRKKCIDSGLIRARQLSWESVAQRFIRLYDDL